MTPMGMQCRDCGTRLFPRRFRCFACGGVSFDALPLGAGTVVAFTRVHRPPPGCDYRYLVELLASEDVTVMAVSVDEPRAGGVVSLVLAEDGAVLIEPNKADD